MLGGKQDPDHDELRRQTLWVTSLREANRDGRAMCRMSWGGLEWHPTAQVVSDSADDLSACAAYADLITALLRSGKSRDATVMWTNRLLAVRDRHPLAFGHPDTVRMFPAGDSTRKQGLVVLQRDGMDGMLTPGGARDLAAVWKRAAIESHHDRTTTLALRQVLDASDTQIEAVMARKLHLNNDKDDLDTFLQDEAGRRNPNT